MTTTESSTPQRNSTIAFLGLGPMGVAIAHTVLGAGRDVVVWNRSAKDLDALGLAGARSAKDIADAVSGASIVAVCVRDHDVARELIDEMSASLTPAAVVVNFSTGTPNETVHSAQQAQRRGIRYVSAAIMVPTPMIGTELAQVLYAGERTDFDAIAPVAQAVGGADYLGADHAEPAVLDIAMLNVYFAGMQAFLHSAVIARRFGVEPDRFLPYGLSITAALGASLEGLAGAYRDRDYAKGDARLDMCLSFLEHIVSTSESVGVAPGLAAVVRDTTVRAAQTYPLSTDWDAIVEVL